MLTPGGREGDASPLGKGKRKLSDYEREVAHALMRRGVQPKSRAIAMARGIIDRAATSGRWGRGKKASPNVVAGAVASVAQRKAFSGATIPAMAAKDLLFAVLDKDARDALDTSQFAIPETRSYPIPDLTHARVALAMVKMHGTPAEQAKVRAAVAKRYPTLKLSNSTRELVLAEAASRGIVDLGRDGATWKHGWIPTNAIASAIKLKKRGSSSVSGKSRINVRSNVEHSLAPKGKAKTSAVQRARGEAARRAEGMTPQREGSSEIQAKSEGALSAIVQGKTAHTDRQRATARAELARRNRAAEDANAEKLTGGKVTLKGNESYNLTTGKRVETTSGDHAKYMAGGKTAIERMRAGGYVAGGDSPALREQKARDEVESYSQMFTPDRLKLAQDNAAFGVNNSDTGYNVHRVIHAFGNTPAADRHNAANKAAYDKAQVDIAKRAADAKKGLKDASREIGQTWQAARDRRAGALPGKDAPLPEGRKVTAHELQSGKGEIRDAESGYIISTGHVSVRRARTVANAHNLRTEQAAVARDNAVSRAKLEAENRAARTAGAVKKPRKK